MRCATLALACALAAPAARAHAHEFYDAQCCGGADCHPVACEQITAVPGGFDYQDPRDHAIYFFTRNKMIPSQDDRCHVCLHGSITHSPQCLYLPVNTRARPPRGEVSARARVTLVALSYAVHLIAVTGPDRQVILLNPLEVVTVRTPRGEEGHFAKGVRCLVHTTDGKVVAVLEECATVRALLDQQER